MQTAAALRSSPIVLLDPAATGKTPDQKRKLTLIEVEGPGGPLEPLVNNTRWDGIEEDSIPPTPVPGAVYDGHANYLTELPRVGSTEVWEIINLTTDAHPIHLHLVQFQILSRRAFRRSTSFSQEPRCRLLWGRAQLLLRIGCHHRTLDVRRNVGIATESVGCIRLEVVPRRAVAGNDEE
jgi:FtsP/CotA-like multicopper oxidase with cupredoxin domain